MDHADDDETKALAQEKTIDAIRTAFDDDDSVMAAASVTAVLLEHPTTVNMLVQIWKRTDGAPEHICVFPGPLFNRIIQLLVGDVRPTEDDWRAVHKETNVFVTDLIKTFLSLHGVQAPDGDLDQATVSYSSMSLLDNLATSIETIHSTLKKLEGHVSPSNTPILVSTFTVGSRVETSAEPNPPPNYNNPSIN